MYGSKGFKSYMGARRMGRSYRFVPCGICGKELQVVGFNMVNGGRKIGGRPWDPIFACLDHTDFEVEVWRVKTNRRVYVEPSE